MEPRRSYAVMAHLIPLVLPECPNLCRFLIPAPNVASQVAAYKVIASLLAPAMECHKLDAIKYVDHRLANYLSLAHQADLMIPPAFAEARALSLHDALEKERAALLSAPAGEGTSSRGEGGGQATQGILTTLVNLRAEPLIFELELSLQQVWGLTERRPAEVFCLVMESKSLACIAILFGNVTGVKGAGPICAILEQAAVERLNYFTFKLATPPEADRRPDTTLWYNYPQSVDTSVKSSDFDGFAKLNLFELGAQIRKLREHVPIAPADAPKKGQEFGMGNAAYHLSLLEYIQI